VRLAQTAGSEVVGIGVLIEKVFEGGRESLKKLNVPVEALARVADMSKERIVFVD
jgi:xanthine phosphoribosyltransferase